MDELLFSYGTLQLESVQLDTFGRLLEGREDVLVGYKLSMVEIRDEQVIAVSGERFHPIVAYTGRPDDIVKGTAYSMTLAELAQSDEYEVSDYKRVSADLRSDRKAWVYVHI